VAKLAARGEEEWEKMISGTYVLMSGPRESSRVILVHGTRANVVRRRKEWHVLGSEWIIMVLALLGEEY